MSITANTKNYKASTAIGRYHIAKLTATDGEVAVATAAGDALIGTTTDIDAEIGEPCDVHHAGVAQVKLGGTVAAGDLLTADGSGQGVKAAPAAGDNAAVIGRALSAGVDGDVIYVALSLSQIQG